MSKKLEEFKYIAEQIHRSFDRRNSHVVDELIAFAEEQQSMIDIQNKLLDTYDVRLVEWKTQAKEIDSLKLKMNALIDEKSNVQYEWLWQNCKIVYFPLSDDKIGTYPIEHNSFARKDARGFIESKMDLSNNDVKKFKLGDKVQKTRGSQWHGTIVGTYSTELTPEGYAVESDTEKGSVQIYPVNALELMKED